MNVHLFWIAIVFLMLSPLSGASAQGNLCSDEPGSRECEECILRFSGDEASQRRMRSFMCYGGAKLPTPGPKRPPEPSVELCNFSTCPSGLAAYEACVAHGATLARTPRVKNLADRYAALIVRELADICAPDGLQTVKAEVDNLMPNYGYFTPDKRKAFNACIDSQVKSRYDLVARFEKGGIESGISVLGKRNAEDEIGKLYRLQGLASVMGIFDTGRTLTNLSTRISADSKICKELVSK